MSTNAASDNEDEEKGNAVKGCLGVFVILALIFWGISSCGGDDSEDVPAAVESETTESVSETPQEDSEQDAMPWLESQFGQEPAEVLVQDPTIWYGYVNGAYLDGGRLHVQLQIDRSEKQIGQQAAKALSNFVMFSNDPLVENVDWAIAENGVGEFIAQEKVRR